MSMVERVARAMWVVGGSTLPFESLGDPEYAELKKSVLEEARAAIAAMREPTEGMVQVLTNFDIERGCYSDHNCTHNLWDHEAPILWQAAIDEALR